VANENETRRWNHPDWVSSWPRRETLTDAVTPFLLDAIGAAPGDRVCDIGCGGGGLSLSVAAAVAPEGSVVGLDLSAGLLELARQRADDAGRANVRFVEMDVQTSDEEPGPFDIGMSQFGVMFFDEPTKAFRGIRRRIAPTGRCVFACWQGVERNPWHVGTVLRRFVTPPATPGPGKSPVGPFAFGDDDYVREVLEGAGFGAVHARTCSTTARGPARSVFDRSLLGMMGVDAAHLDEATAAVERHLEQFAVGPDAFEFPLAFWIFDAAAS
jgi:SAM-dependent methyltransferase